MRNTQTPERWCVIGAGPSGLAALKNLLEVGIEAECLEREGDIGGNWDFRSPASAVIASTRLISSRKLTEYTDYPMPRDWPDHPTHAQVLEYLRGYAAHFGLRDRIRPRHPVERIEPAGGNGGGWTVHVASHGPRQYRGVVVATGHNRAPRRPTIPGSFDGRLMHACEYKSPDEPVSITGRRVLVVGGGNSGTDIAVECSRHAAVTWHSTRRRYHVIPRMILGRPADLRVERLLGMGTPLWLRRKIALRGIDRVIGLPHRHGLSPPDHQLWETHPVINDALYERIDSGAIVPVGDVARFDGETVHFADGRRQAFDIVILATGYRSTMPFLDPRHLGAVGATSETADEAPQLFLHMLHPVRDDIAIVGLIQPDSGQWGLTDLQARLVARMAVAATSCPRALAWLHRRRAVGWSPGPVRYIDSPRHALEVEHHSYKRSIERLIDGMDRRLRATA